MAGVPRPDPCFLDNLEACGAPDGRKRWRNHARDRYFTWDHVHGHIEVFNKRGGHLGVIHVVTGQRLSGPVPGRRIDV